jgi:pimeloyl-[acyl-carrier protein] synthase
VLGVPAEHVPWIDQRMITLGLGFAHQRDPEFLRAASDAATELQAYFDELLDERRAAPADDLLTALSQQLPNDPETRADTVANCVLFIIAGHATTTSLIAGGTLLLLENGQAPSHAQIPGAVEEMLRLITPTRSTAAQSLPTSTASCSSPQRTGTPRSSRIPTASTSPAAPTHT